MKIQNIYIVVLCLSLSSIFLTGCNPEVVNPSKSGQVYFNINLPSSSTGGSNIKNAWFLNKINQGLGKSVSPNTIKADTAVVPVIDEVKVLILDMTQWRDDTTFINAWENDSQYVFIDNNIIEKMLAENADYFDAWCTGFKSYPGTHYKYIGDYSFPINSGKAKGDVYLNPGLNYIFYAFRSNGKTVNIGNTVSVGALFFVISETEENIITLGAEMPPVDSAVPITMIGVTGGTFAMGSTTGKSDEQPVHLVTLSSFSISRTEVTQGQWKAVMGNNPSLYNTAGDNAEVEQVNWYVCVSFCNKLSIKEGKTPCYSINGNTSPADWTVGTIICDFTAKGYRLPTEAEWEFAARGGTKSRGYIYSGSNNIDDVAWYSSDTRPHAVGKKAPNELGLYDMSGNVSEWCWDYYGSYTSASQTNPTGSTTVSDYHLLRGGSIYSTVASCSTAARIHAQAAIYGHNSIGFRVASSQTTVTPSAPTLVQPLNSSLNVNLPPTLSWSASTGATSYTLQISTSSTFSSFVYNQSGLTSVSQQNTGLANSTQYYWRVNATNSAGTSGWSNVWSFTTINSIPVGMVMISVSGGAFIMGDTTSAYSAIPLHSVTLSSFSISKTEITQWQWTSIMGSNPSNYTSVGDNAPVESVAWYDCINFCNKLSISEGKTPCYSIGGNTSPSDWSTGIVECNFSVRGYRLPTESEWEFAAKGGNSSLGYTYSGGNSISPLAWCVSNSNLIHHVAGTKAGNELGLYDMSGNVYEWCWDTYANYTSTAQTNPTGPAYGNNKILRGGAFLSSESQCRSAIRYSGDRTFKYSYNGFRVVLAN